LKKAINNRMNHSMKWQPRYKTTLAGSGLLLPELATLGAGLSGKEADIGLRERVLSDNILAKPSSQARLTIWKKLVSRYGIPSSDEVSRFWWALLPEASNADLAQLAALRWAQHDLLLRFLWNEVYLPRRHMASPIQSADVIGFIKGIEGAHPGRRFFLSRSETVQVRMAQHFLLLLRDCGAATGKRNKSLMTPPVGRHAAQFAAFLARTELPGSSEVLTHWALRWWGGGESRADDILREGQQGMPSQ
jgi:hypothetical protein